MKEEKKLYSEILDHIADLKRNVEILAKRNRRLEIIMSKQEEVLKQLIQNSILTAETIDDIAEFLEDSTGSTVEFMKDVCDRMDMDVSDFVDLEEDAFRPILEDSKIDVPKLYSAEEILNDVSPDDDSE